MELSFTLIALISLAWVIGRLLVTVIPLQIKEARVVNGLAKLRRQMLISGVSAWLVSVFGFLMLLFSLFYPFDELFMEMLVISLTTSMVINAESKYRIYHQQYSEDHKRLSRKVFAEEQAQKIQRRFDSLSPMVAKNDADKDHPSKPHPDAS